MTKERPTLEKLIKLNQTWISRTYKLHSIKIYEISRKKIKLFLDCGMIIIVNNSKTSASVRHLKNNKYRKACKYCTVSKEQIERFTTKIFKNIGLNKNTEIIKHKISSNNYKVNINDKINEKAIEITENMKQRLEFFIKTEIEKENIKNINTMKHAKELEIRLIETRNKELIEIYKKTKQNDLVKLEQNISSFLHKKGFLEIKSSILISKKHIELMGINPINDPNYKLFQVQENLFLRPMLAPGLYVNLKKLDKILPDPIKIFEIGKCFRRESDTKSHLEEFTMVNFCQMGKDSDEKALMILIKELLNYLKIEYSIIKDECIVYGKTIDIMYNNLELSSAVIGPVKIDIDWGITKKWIGAGFGLERLLKV